MSKTMFKTMKLNIGPQHPSTHGVLRLVTELDGEIIESVTPVIGYLHRGLEKMAETRSYLQYLPLVDRIDYLSGSFNSYAFCNGVEILSGIEIPKRAKYIRTLFMELNRLASHQLWLGSMMLDLGATTPLFYCFRDREVILSLFEQLTGQRMMYNYFIFGGVRWDIENEWLDSVLDYINQMPENIKDYEKIITENPIFEVRMKEKCILTKKMALQYSITGPNLRASGINLDFRKTQPYLIYDELDFEPALGGDKGDSFERYIVRIKEMYLCLELIKQCISWLKNNAGDVNLTTIKAPILKVPEGEVNSIVESPRGLTSCFIKSDGTKKPYRVKWRTGSFYTVQLLPELLKGTLYPDLMAIFGSLDVILPEVDR